MDDVTQILAAAEQLYAAALAPEEWAPALAAIISLLGAGHAINLAFATGRAAAPFVTSAGVDERDLAVSLAATLEGRSQPVDFAALPRGRPLLRSALIPDRDYALTEAYNEITRPINGWHGIIALQRRATAGYQLGFCRPQAAADFEARELTLLQALLPHFTMAIEFHFRLSAARQRSEGFERLLDRLDVGAILIDAAGAPVFVNREAARIAAEGDGLAVNEAGLGGAAAEETRRLRNAIAAVAAPAVDPLADPCTEERLVLRRPSGRPPLLLTLLPIWRLGTRLAGVRTPRVAVFVKETNAPMTIRRTALVEAFGLTPREAEIAVLLAEGLPPDAIAAVAGVGVPSVREYLKRAFGKTRTHSQAALVALVRGFAEPYH